MAATYRLTILSSNTGNGAISVSPENIYGYYAEGALITVSVVPDDGYTFVNWQVNSVVQSTLASFVYTMPDQDVFLFAHYSGNYIPAYTFGTKYLSEYYTNNGTITRIEIQPKNYAGVSNVVCVTNVSFRFGNNGSEIRKTIIGSSLDFSFPVMVDGDFNEFLSADLRAFRVVYYRGYVNASTYDFKWTGYLTTDVFEEPHAYPSYLINLTATDGLKALEKPVDGFVASMLDAARTIAGALRKVFPDPFPVKEAVAIFETRMDNTGSLFNQYSHNSDLFFNKFQPFFYDNGGIKWNDTISIEKAIIKILSPWVCRIFQWDSHWYILRINELVKASIKYSKFDSFGVFVSSENVNNNLQVLECGLFDRPIDVGQLGYTEFNASLILGDVDVPELNEILVEPFEGEGSWISTDPIRWVLKRWQYVYCTAFDGVRDNDICRIEYISSVTDGTSGSYAQFWGTANGLADPKLSYIESNKDSRIVGASVAIETANTISVGAKFQILRRGTADSSIPASGSHLVGIAVQIGSNYLYETATAEVYGWTLTPTIITFPANNAGVFNTIKITNVVVPESGDVQFRLYQLITVSGTRHRYVIDWDDAYIQLEKNDGLVNEAILGKAVTTTEYPSIAPDYETFIGDALTNLSSSAIRLNTVADSPVSAAWSRDGIESLELLQIVVQDLANLEGKNNYRMRGTYYGPINPTKSVIFNSHKYLVNSYVLNDWENSYDLDLFDLGLNETT